jgi:hypothetical protein
MPSTAKKYLRRKCDDGLPTKVRLGFFVHDLGDLPTEASRIEIAIFEVNPTETT